jgi:hypothetical protein
VTPTRIALDRAEFPVSRGQIAIVKAESPTSITASRGLERRVSGLATAKGALARLGDAPSVLQSAVRVLETAVRQLQTLFAVLET